MRGDFSLKLGSLSWTHYCELIKLFSLQDHGCSHQPKQRQVLHLQRLHHQCLHMCESDLPSYVKLHESICNDTDLLSCIYSCMCYIRHCWSEKSSLELSVTPVFITSAWFPQFSCQLVLLILWFESHCSCPYRQNFLILSSIFIMGWDFSCSLVS